MVLKTLLVFLLHLLVLTPCCYAEPTITTEFDFYSIYPNSKTDLKSELCRQSPIIVGGETFLGHTEWLVKWKFRWREENKICHITSVTTFLNVTYIMPQIPPHHPATQATRDAFNYYYKALFGHEENHQKSGLYAAREIEETLMQLGTFTNCQTLEKTANTAGDKLIQKYQRRDREYDKTTQHGKLEGIMVENFL